MLRRTTALPLILLSACVSTIDTNSSPNRGDKADNATAVAPKAAALRVATYNVEDLRTDAISSGDDDRLRIVAATIQAIGADILVMNEIDYDHPGTPGYVAGAAVGQNAQRFADNYLRVAQREGLTPVQYRAYMFPSNTGELTGFDLDNNGMIADANTADGRKYGGDCYGFGEYPGKYAFALFVREDLRVDETNIRTFQNLLWSSMPGALAPTRPSSGEPFYTDEEWNTLRLSSKNHVDVPVIIDEETSIHFLLSHPTPPVFDGSEDRNGKRNHDEIRFWGDFLSNADYVVDDQGVQGGLPEGERFFIMGDLNSDLDEGDSVDDPVGRFLLSHPRVTDFTPLAPPGTFGTFSPDDTAHFGARIDYVIPERSIVVQSGSVVHPLWSEGEDASDHFPVWLDVNVPSAAVPMSDPSSDAGTGAAVDAASDAGTEPVPDATL